LIVDDFGLRRLSAQQSQDLYELIVERQRRSSFAFTSNRGIDEWLGLFDDPILGNSGPGSPGERGAPGGDRGLQLPRQAGA
jgi:DNA replication protein DnaC